MVIYIKYTMEKWKTRTYKAYIQSQPTCLLSSIIIKHVLLLQLKTPLQQNTYISDVALTEL